MCPKQAKIIEIRFRVLVPSVSGYDNEHKTMKNENQTGLKNFKPKINLNHNSYAATKIDGCSKSHSCIAM